MSRALRHPGFRRLFTGLATSSLGDAVMLLVLSMWVKALTGSNARAGLTFLFMLLPSLAAPAFGVLVDRLPRKPVLVWGNLLSALVVLPLLLVRGADDVWLIYLVAVGYGVSFVVLPGALNGVLQVMLPEDVLVDANATLQTAKEAFRLFGPLVGAGVYAVAGGGAVALLDAVSFVVAAAVIATVRVEEQRAVREPQHWWAETTEGVRHLAADPVLRPTLIGLGLTLLVIGFTESAIYAVLDFYGRPVTFAGVLVTVQGVGALAGGLTAARWVRRVGEPATLVVATGVLAVGLAMMAAISRLGVALASCAVLGYALPVLLVAFTTLLQRRTPPAVMGRVSAAVEVVTGTPQAVSLAVGAFLVTVLDFHVVFAVMATVVAGAGGYLVLALRGRLRPPAPARYARRRPSLTAPPADAP